MDRTARLATNRPPASNTARPANKAIIIHMSDLDEDELPDEDPSAMTNFSQAGEIRPTLSLAEVRPLTAGKPVGCALSVPVLTFRRHFFEARLDCATTK